MGASAIRPGCCIGYWIIPGCIGYCIIPGCIGCIMPGGYITPGCSITGCSFTRSSIIGCYIMPGYCIIPGCMGC